MQADHEAAPFQMMPALEPDEYQALKHDIEAHGVLVAIEYDDVGNILDGHHRVRACTELDITDWPRVVRSGMTDDEKRAHAIRLNLNRRQLSRKLREALWLEMRKVGMTYRAIAAADGTVCDTTVMHAVNSVAGNAATALPEVVTGKDGKQYSAKKKAKEEVLDAKEVDVSRQWTPAAVKANAIKAMLDTGHNIEQIADALSLSAANVRSLVRRFHLAKVERKGRHSAAIDPAHVIRETVNAVIATSQGLRMIKVDHIAIDVGEADAMLAELRGAMKSLRYLEKILKGLSHEQAV